jgi:hypothetical protein
LVIVSALLMWRNLKVGFVLFIALQGFEIFQAFEARAEVATLLPRGMLMPAAKASVALFFLVGSGER